MASKRRKHTGSRGHRRDRPNAETIAAASNSEPTAPVELGESAALPSVSARLSDWILPLEPLLARVGGGDARVGAALAGTLGVTALVFSRCLANAFVFDDDDMIVINRQIGNWSFIWKSLVNDSWWFRDPNRLPQSAYYRPFQDIWLWLNFHLFGLVPAPWHAAMIGLHLVVVWLAFRIASQLATDKWAGVLAAGLFALMPLHAEPVVWASAIPLPLAAAFEFGAFECYLRWRTESPEPQLKWLVLSLGLFAGALLSHESAIVFPLLVAAHSYLFPLPIPPGAAEFAGDAARSEADLVEDTVAAIRPFVYEAAAYIILRLWVLGVISGPNSDNHMTALDVALTIPGVIVSYVALLFAPWLAGPIYRLNIVHGIGSSGFWPPVIVLAGITGVGIALLRNNPRRSLYLFSSLWILIAIGPSLNLTGLFPQSLIQDRYVYFASFGFCLMAADIAVRFARTSDARAKAVSIGVAAIAAIYAGMLLYVQGYWRDEIALFWRCTAVVPDAAFFHNRLAMALEGRGDLSRARDEFNLAAKLDPANGWNLYDLSLVDLGLGDKRGAEQAMAGGLEKFKNPPAGAYTELAIVADAAGDKTGMENALKRAAALPGGAELAALTRAQIQFAHGDKAGSEKALRELLKHDPGNPDLHSALGAVLGSQGRNEEALAEFGRAAAIAPNLRSLHFQTATILHNLHRDREASAECREALQANPNDHDAQALMAELDRTASPTP